MVTEISLAIIAAMLIVIAFVLTITSFRSKKAIQVIQGDVHHISQEVARVLNTINDFIQTDLHSISQETHHLISNINSLSSDVKNKVNSMNFLFRPLGFLNSKLGPDVSSHHCETVPQILKWIASSIFLYKTTKEFINHEK